MSTVRTKPGKKSGVVIPLKRGEVLKAGRPPKGTTPKKAGAKLSRKAAEGKL